MAQFPQNSPDRRLDSWKEIAAFFGRNERTVRRWATDRGLPVHRIPGAVKGRIFAFEAELHQWLATSGEQSPPAQSQDTQPKPGPELLAHFGLRPVKKWLAALALCAAVAGLLAFRFSHRLIVHALPMTEPSVGNSSTPRTESSQAEELYLQGRYYWNRRTPEDLNRA